MYKKDERIIIGIDPGYDRVGVSIIKKDGTQDILVFSVCIETNKKDLPDKRILDIYNQINIILDKYKPELMCIESLFIFKNQKTVMRVSEARGAIILCASIKNIKVLELTPMQIKNSIAGDGHADKKQVKYMVEKVLKIKFNDEILDDEIDAVACGLSGLAFSKNI
jgi:crossover junction endodeoxyribonuclease RuvC